MEPVATKSTLKGTEQLVQTVSALARLLDQAMNDIQTVDTEFQEELGHSAEKLKIAMQEAERNGNELKKFREAATAWETEKAGLVAEKAGLVAAMAETDEAASIALETQIATAVERVRSEINARWEADRATLLADRNRAQQRLADMATECDTLKQELEAARKSLNVEAIEAEVARVETLIQEISRVVDNQETELSVIIRKNVERAELESYLKGLRFKTK
jgi:hypothetical protein